jgi:DUF1680 family protein
LLSAACALAAPCAAAPHGGKGRMAMQKLPGSTWRFEGELGARIARNVDHWLLRAPGANPGMLDMFHRRDRHLPYADIVPWAGEFAGKYLISAVQACRMSPDPRLKPVVRAFANDLIACQDADGYLGPFPKARRLMGDCDLWGHYHCMLGLLMWHDDTGDPRAYDCVLRAADCICRLYVDGKRRPIQAGNPNFNLGVYHVMAELYRRTGNPRYLALVRRIEEDLPKDGDWLRQGLEGVPYYRLPGSGPRWEALHILQGFCTMYEATGDERYRKALLSLWQSIRRLDRHPSGAFSTNEQASGTIYASGSIETCCSVAWMALTIDALRLTGDATMADELELTLWNQALAAQHPSGSWCTYDTPLNGVRAPSYEEISFQYRPGAPELNCCSVNSPRTLGMLSEWAVMAAPKSAGAGPAIVVNFYGPGAFDLPLTPASRLRLVERTAYPVGGTVDLAVEPQRRARFALRLRIPAWSARTRVTLNGAARPETVSPGAYFTIDRTWSRGDVVRLEFDMTPRLSVGRGPDRGGRAAIHVGPLLLAFDAGHNAIETADLKPIDFSNLRLKSVPATGVWPPMGMWRTATEGGSAITLCDFASAGASGTDYAAWIPASHMPPPAVSLQLPAADAAGRPGPALMHWSGCGGPDETYDVLLAKSADMQAPVMSLKGLKSPTSTVDLSNLADGDYWWQVRANNEWGSTVNEGGPRRLHVSRTAPAPFTSIRDDGLMIASPLAGDGKPSFGRKSLEEGVAPGSDRHDAPARALVFGPSSKLRYELPFFPERDYTFIGWACPESLPSGGGQVFSAWCRGSDDPLRVIVAGHEVFARIEAGAAYSTPGVYVEQGKWVHLAAVKQGATLTLYVNGKAAQTTAVQEYVRSMSTQIGIGFNPLIGSEHFIGRIADVAFYARALTADEIKAAAKAP